jgi:hypothetical protein
MVSNPLPEPKESITVLRFEKKIDGKWVKKLDKPKQTGNGGNLLNYHKVFLIYFSPQT